MKQAINDPFTLNHSFSSFVLVFGILVGISCWFLVFSSLIFYISVLTNCGEPGSPSNGLKHCSRYWIGESVSFVCEPEYHLTGPAARMCLPSSNWSGVQPSCKYITVNIDSLITMNVRC